ncbi:MAG: TetR family transcriptional regulator, partial [Aestuariivita sp.]|nr:TetR family transcriptional regulator [Aestuariivita sp.]
AWVSLISEVPHSKQCQRIQMACNERILSNLRNEIKHFLPKAEAAMAARHLGILIDGLWVRAGLLITQVNSNSAISEIEFAVKKLLPSDNISIEKHKSARKKIEAIASIALNSKAFQEQNLKVINH